MKPVGDVYADWYKKNSGLLAGGSQKMIKAFASVAVDYLKHLGYPCVTIKNDWSTMSVIDHVPWLREHCSGYNSTCLHPEGHTVIFFTTDELAVQFRLTFQTNCI